jgi:hypothetical protein
MQRRLVVQVGGVVLVAVMLVVVWWRNVIDAVIGQDGDMYLDGNRDDNQMALRRRLGAIKTIQRPTRWRCIQ